MLALLAESWRLYRANLWTYLGYASWLFLPLMVFLFLNAIPSHPLVSALAILTTIAQVFMGLWIVICLMHVTVGLTQEKAPEPQALSKLAATRIPSLLATAFLQALAVLGGLILLIVPGVIFWVWFAFAQMATALDGKRPMEALTASRSLVQGRFSFVFWRLLGGPLIIAIVYTAIMSAIISVISIVVGFDPTTLLTTQELPLWIMAIEGVGEVFLFPLLLVYMVLLYLDLKKSTVA